MKMQKFYDEATDHLGILVKHAEEEQDKLAVARKALAAESGSVRTEIRMVRDALYGRMPIYPSHFHDAQLPPEKPILKKPEVFTPEVRAKMEERLAALEEKQDKTMSSSRRTTKHFWLLPALLKTCPKRGRSLLRRQPCLFGFMKTGIRTAVFKQKKTNYR